MILGRLDDVAKHAGALPPAILRALRHLQSLDIKRLEPGRREIEGDRLFFSVDEIALRSMEESRVEAHRRYADIQLPLATVERFGFSLPQEGLLPSDEQFDARDVAFYPKPSNETFIDVEPGCYIVFLPGELHRPCLRCGAAANQRKIVVKIDSALLFD